MAAVLLNLKVTFLLPSPSTPPPDAVGLSLNARHTTTPSLSQVSLKNNFLEAYINLARAQRELRKFKEAEDNLRIAKKLNPDFLEVNVLLGKKFGTFIKASESKFLGALALLTILLTKVSAS